MTLPVASLVGTVYPFWMGYLDFNGDPVRVTTLPESFIPSATGDADLDGFTFISLPAAFVKVFPVTYSIGGSDSLNVSLSGIPGADTSILASIATAANWRGRTARLWRGLCNSSYAPTLVEAYYTGYMMAAEFNGDPTGQVINITIENYIAILTTARRRTYQDQTEHDAGDLSPSRIRAAANGIQSSTGIVMGGGGGNRFDQNQYENER